MKNMKLMQMSRQVNLYLTQENIEQIQNYLTERNFVFIRDEIRNEPTLAYMDYLFRFPNMTRYVAFADSQLDYMVWETKGQKKFRVQAEQAAVLSFNWLGKKDDFFRVRFYYCPYYFENHEKKFKNTEFGLHVERFFRWLRRQFKPVPDMPTFYYNPDFVPTEWF